MNHWCSIDNTQEKLGKGEGGLGIKTPITIHTNKTYIQIFKTNSFALLLFALCSMLYALN
jgi:hypothetical protein